MYQYVNQIWLYRFECEAGCGKCLEHNYKTDNNEDQNVPTNAEFMKMYRTGHCLKYAAHVGEQSREYREMKKINEGEKQRMRSFLSVEKI